MTGTALCATPATALSIVAGSPYVITCTQGNLAANNYDFTPFVSGILTVTRATLTIRPNDRVKYYAMEIVLGNTAFVATGLFGQDTVGSVSLASAGEPIAASAGLYPIAGSAAQGVGLDNYTIVYVNGTLTVLGIDYNCYETQVKAQPDRKLTSSAATRSPPRP